jgi:hypothetical protein
VAVGGGRVKVTVQEAGAVFKKYGHDKKGHMPYKVRAEAIGM